MCQTCALCVLSDSLAATGRTPYSGANIYQMYDEITNQRLRFPSEPALSTEARTMISALLFINPKNRLGCSSMGFKDIREHAWFSNVQPTLWVVKDKLRRSKVLKGKLCGFDWRALEASSLEAPYIPPTSNTLTREKVNYSKLHAQVLNGVPLCSQWNLTLEHAL